MERIVSVAQVRRAEAHTMRVTGATALDLMERAGKAVADRLLGDRGTVPEPGPSGRYRFLIGPGNNGGDGLVTARLLHAQGRTVQVHLWETERTTAGYDHQLSAARDAGVPIAALTDAEQLTLASDDVVVDALYGIGLRAPLDGPILEVIDRVNASEAPVVAIDVPSGLMADGLGTGRCVKAACTMTFQWVKPALVAPEWAQVVGHLDVLPIGLALDPEDEGVVGAWLLDRSDPYGMLQERAVNGHKGTFGHAVLVAGSVGKFGASVLATRACLRSGVGTVTAHVPSDAAQVIHTAVPEAMCSSDVERDHVSNLPKGLVGTAWGIGPGLGSAEATALVLKRLIQDPLGPLVMDADALNILAQQPTWMAFLAPGTILTPHPKEFDRLTGCTCSGTAERWAQGREMALRTGCVVVLKGGATAICTPSGQVLVQRWLNSGLAKGGSGDALTGLITGLRAQGYGPVAAACIGVYLHGSAARLVADERGQDGMSVSDVIERIPEAWMALRRPLEEPFDGPLAVS